MALSEGRDTEDATELLKPLESLHGKMLLYIPHLWKKQAGVAIKQKI